MSIKFFDADESVIISIEKDIQLEEAAAGEILTEPTALITTTSQQEKIPDDIMCTGLISFIFAFASWVAWAVNDEEHIKLALLICAIVSSAISLFSCTAGIKITCRQNGTNGPGESEEISQRSINVRRARMS